MIPELLIIDNSIVFIAISVLGALCYSYSRVQKWNPASTAPLSTPLSGRDGVFAKFKYFSEAKSWLWDGVQKYPGRLFRLRTPDGYLHVAAHEQLPELNRLGEDQLRVAFTDKMMCQYTKMAVSPLGLSALKEGLIQNLGTLTPKIIDEAIHSVDMELEGCEDWTPRNVHQMSCRAVAAIGSSIMSGPELSSNPAWTDLLISYSSDVCHTSIWLKLVPPHFRQTVSNIMPSVRRIRRHRVAAHRMVIPVLEARQKASKDTGYLRPNDLMQWIADKFASEESNQNLEYQAELQLSNGLATILSSSVACTHALFDLAYYTEYMEPLREEIDSIIAADNGLTREGLARMEKLDSFLKESQRHNVANFSTWDRKTLQPITLQDGTHIGKGAYISLPVSNVPADPTICRNPGEFDGFRFYNFRRQSPENASRYQFTSTERYSLHFGYGRHACPGRFFASTQLKAVLAWIIRNWDIRFEDSVRQRPTNKVFGLDMGPDTRISLEFKLRSTP